jgi:hypothetical protein
MFVNREWPEGYEFPSCQSCNNATRHDEQVMAMISRLYPEGRTDAERKEMSRIIEAVRKNYPGVIPELLPTPEMLRRYESRPWSGAWGRPVALDGPLVNRSAEAFARKLFSALHYKEFNKIIPSEGGIMLRWYSLSDRLDNKLPNELISMMSKKALIQRGKRDLSDQFSYTFFKIVDGELSAYFVAFRQAFAMLGFVEMDASLFETEELPRILRPLQPVKLDT